MAPIHNEILVHIVPKYSICTVNILKLFSNHHFGSLQWSHNTPTHSHQSPKKFQTYNHIASAINHAIFGLPNLWATRGAFLITFHKKLSPYYPTGIRLPTVSPNWRLSPGKSVRDNRQSLQTPWIPGVINRHNHPQISWGSVWVRA